MIAHKMPRRRLFARTGLTIFQLPALICANETACPICPAQPVRLQLLYAMVGQLQDVVADAAASEVDRVTLLSIRAQSVA
jgi:hypothetical protein